jgi:hypothetical protein
VQPSSSTHLSVHVGEGGEEGDEHALHNVRLSHVSPPPAQLHVQVACRRVQRAAWLAGQHTQARSSPRRCSAPRLEPGQPVSSMTQAPCPPPCSPLAAYSWTR